MGYEGIITCPKCGAKYELYKAKTIMRDRDSLECEYCDTRLYKWNEAAMYTIKLIQKGNYQSK